MFGINLFFTERGTSPESIKLYTATVGVAVQVGMLVCSWLLRYGSIYLKRKELIVDNFLQQMATLQVEKDFGVSVQALATICRRWSDRWVTTNVILLVVAIYLWQRAEEDYTQTLIAATVGMQQECKA